VARTSLCSRPRADCAQSADLPEFEEIWELASWYFRHVHGTAGIVRAFRCNPGTEKLPTPSAKIEITSAANRYFDTPIAHSPSRCPPRPNRRTPPPPPPPPPPPNALLPALFWSPISRRRAMAQPTLDFGSASLASKSSGASRCAFPPPRMRRHAANAMATSSALYKSAATALPAPVLSDALRPGGGLLCK